MTHGFNPDRSQTYKGGRYDHRHAKARKVAAAKHQPTDLCYRCAHPLGPMGRWLHLDHTDDGTGYGGFSHGTQPCTTCGRRCNIQAGSDEGNRRQGITTPPPRRRATRIW